MKKYLSLEEQVELLKSRGMVFDSKIEAINKLKYINYYKIKQASLPYMNENGVYKENTNFKDVIYRFYEDRNLRLYFMRIIEKIEMSIKTHISEILGRELGDLGYLKFKNWTDSNEYCKYYIKYKERDFNKRKIKNISQSKNTLVAEYKNYNTIPVWLIMDVLTFGEMLDFFKLMKHEYKSEIAIRHNTTVNHLTSWLENINLIRNLSAHNSNVIDLKVKTKPKILSNWKNRIELNSNGKYTNKIVNTILIMEHLTIEINPKFPGKAIKKSILRLYNKDKDIINQIGFKNLEELRKLKI